MANLRVQLKAHMLARTSGWPSPTSCSAPTSCPRATAPQPILPPTWAGRRHRHRPAHKNRQPARNRPVSVRHPLPAGRGDGAQGRADLPLAEEDCTREQAQEQWRPRAAPASRRCSPAAPSRSCCPTPTSPPAAKPTRPPAPTPSRPGGFLSTHPRHPATGLRAVVAPLRAPGRGIPHRLHRCAPRARSCMAWCGAAGRRGREAARPSPRSSHPARLRHRRRWCSTTSSPWNTATTGAAPHAYPPRRRGAVHAELPEEQAEQMPKHLH